MEHRCGLLDAASSMLAPGKKSTHLGQSSMQGWGEVRSRVGEGPIGGMTEPLCKGHKQRKPGVVKVGFLIDIG